jgi:hypothetical protein
MVRLEPVMIILFGRLCSVSAMADITFFLPLWGN